MKLLVNLFYSFVLLLSISGCASNKYQIVPREERVNLPPLNEVKQAELGDTIITKGKVHIYDGFDLKNEVHAGEGVFIKKWTVEPGKLTARKEDKNWVYFYADTFTVTDSMIGTINQIGGLKQSKTNANVFKVFREGNSIGLLPTSKPEMSSTKIVAVDTSSFRQELIYNGRSGDSIKFLYRELTYNGLQGSFNQDVQYDLHDGNTIGFKGARIEIIEAANTHLRYKLLATFPDRD